MKKQYFINANIIDPHNSINETGGLIISEEGKIEAVGKKVNTNNLPTREKPIDLKGKYIFPGLVDMRVFVGEPGYEYKENFRTLSNAALAGGVTSVVTMPNTDPIIDNVSIVDFLKRRGRDKSRINIFPCASLTKNIEGNNMTEFGLLQSKGIIAFTDGIKTIQNPRLMSRIMNSAKDIGCLIMQHAEDYELAKNGMINSGIIASKLGLSGIPEIAERILIERDLTLLEKVKCRYHISQLSSQKSIEVIKHRKEIVKFTSGVSKFADRSAQFGVRPLLGVGRGRRFGARSQPAGALRGLWRRQAARPVGTDALRRRSRAAVGRRAWRHADRTRCAHRDAAALSRSGELVRGGADALTPARSARHRALGIFQREFDQPPHRRAGGVGVGGGNRVINEHVIGDRVARQRAQALLELRCPTDRCADRGAEHHQRIVAGGAQDRIVKLPVGRTAQIGRERMPPHRGKCLLHAFEFAAVALGRGHPGGGRFDDQAQFEQAAHQLRIGFADKGPAEHVGVEQIPPVAREHARSRFWSAFDQPLGNQRLDAFAISTARYVERFGKDGLAGKRLARGIFARQDGHAEFVGNGAAQPPPFAARRARWQFAVGCGSGIFSRGEGMFDRHSAEL